eukprot:Transcript_17918.p2 GENE.Transcript_17918~~Transcript_17918.p2  ORF type:complete len:297 (-),score=53.95 Transcript_17918:602-1423(-)
MPRALSDALVADLQGEYSRQLYGQTGRVQPGRLRLIWPQLLTPPVLKSLTARCNQPERHAKGPLNTHAHFWLSHPKNNLQTQGLWLHQPPEHLHGAYDDHAWVEVTHCYYSSEGVRSSTPMWFFAVPGSGLSVNVGRSLRLYGGPSSEDHRATEKVHKSIVKGYVPRFVNVSSPGCAAEATQGEALRDARAPRPRCGTAIAPQRPAKHTRTRTAALALAPRSLAALPQKRRPARAPQGRLHRQPHGRPGRLRQRAVPAAPAPELGRRAVGRPG